MPTDNPTHIIIADYSYQVTEERWGRSTIAMLINDEITVREILLWANTNTVDEASIRFAKIEKWFDLETKP